MIRASPPLFVLLLFVLQAVVVVRAVWIPPRKPLHENVDYTQQESVAMIHSDLDDGNGNVLYSLEGVGANQYPFNVFVVDPETGLIRVTKVLDREDIAMYNLSGVARYRDGSLAERNIFIGFKILDDNDNSPVFGTIKAGEVNELSAPGTSVMKITATDADEPGNENSQIVYSIVDQNPPGDMFYIKNDGTICVKNSGLDREVADKYTLTVRAQDLNGKPGGKSETATVTINIRDVNDNPPTLEKEEYEGSIDENAQGVEVMRFKADDLDQYGTDNWEAVYDIVKGNEAGYFSIKTDPNTNEGILMLDKAVNYEDVKNLELGIAVRNKADGAGGGGGGGGGGTGGGGGGTGGGGGGTGGGGGGTGGGGGGGGGGTNGTGSGTTYKTYPIKISVNNQPEGAGFSPKVKAVPISEGGQSFNINKVIASYPAIDEDTGKPAENVRYAKGSDPDNWLTIDPETAEIKLNKIPDRESPFLVNGTYIAKVLCIPEDGNGKTATGTIAIQVEDFNDHCPTLTSDVQTICTTDDSVIVNAKDEDAFPNGAPFDFAIIPEGTKGKWQVEHLNDTAAILRAQESMWPGSYEVTFVVKDQQGHECPEPQKVNVQVCTCEDGVLCGKRGANGQPSKGSQLGAAGIGLLFLGLLLLLLIPLLLLFCQCGGAGGLPGGFTEMPFDTKSHLINYHTEGQGENTEVPLVNIPVKGDGDMVKIGKGVASKTSAMAPMAGFDVQKSVPSMDGDGMNGAAYQESFSPVYREGTWGMMTQPSGSGFHSEFDSRKSGVGGGMYEGMALPDHFLEQYFSQKVMCGNENLGVKDGLFVYDYEGQGSPAGSVGCCSLLESDNDLQFLDDLGPKFKTLAEVCGGKKIPTEVKQVFTPPPSASINTHTSVSSVVTAQQLPPPPQLQPTVPKTESTVVMETSGRSQMVKESAATAREGITTVKKGKANQGQMLLLQQQQPVYYTTTPVLQPMHYVVQPQVQNTMLLAEAPSTNLQGMVLVNGTQTGPAQGVVVQGQTVTSSRQAQGPGMMLVERSGVLGATANLSGSQPMMVVERSGVHGGSANLSGSQPMMVVESSGVQAAGANLIHTGNLSGSQTMMVMERSGVHGGSANLSGSQPMMVMEGRVPAGSMKVLNGSQTCFMPGGTLQPGGLSGSQSVLVVGGPVSSGGQLVQEAGGLSQKSDISESQRVLYNNGSTSIGSQSSVLGSSTTAMSTTPTHHRVVLQETREIL